MTGRPLLNFVRLDGDQSQAAKLFAGTQPRISDLKRGKINPFGLDALVNMAATAGMHVEMLVQAAA